MRVNRQGLSRGRAYRAWINMRGRCLNPSHPGYQRYGGRGIGVCAAWKDSFDTFRSDMGEPPAGCSLDRIDNNGAYEPGNCRWADNRKQANNKSNNRLIEHDGQAKTLAEWARDLGINPSTLRVRLKAGTPNPFSPGDKRAGWDHGTYTGYCYGCRCEECRTAGSDYKKAFRRKKLTQSIGAD